MSKDVNDSKQQLFPTRFATWNRSGKLGTLTAFGGLVLWALAAAIFQTPASSAPPEKGGNDLRLYRAIVERVHNGESYYDAAGKELRAQGYSTGSVFNWRSPTYAWFFALFPDLIWVRVVAVVLMLLTLQQAFVVMRDQGGPYKAAGLVIPLLGAFLWCLDDDGFLPQELWAGMLLTLSACCYARSRWLAGFLIGLFALFFRELSLPYCLVAAGVACWQRRWKELACWGVGFIGYGLFLAYHWSRVNQMITPADRVPATWIQFGGMLFLLVTCRMNYFLFRFPLWVSALYLPLSVLGLAAWRSPMGLRLGLTAAIYLIAFSVVGQPFNDYWGLLYAPLLPFGLVWASAAIRDLRTLQLENSTHPTTNP